MTYVAEMLGADGFGVYEVDWSSGRLHASRTTADADLRLVPGFIDIHFHGAFGADFMTSSENELRALCSRLRDCAYESVLATTVTAAADDVDAMLERLPFDPMVLGVHLEGPFLSPQFPGAQPKEHLVPAPNGPSEWDRILEDSRLRIVTLAPEVPYALELTARLVNRGVIVSLGHTNATFDECTSGFEFGVRHATHTFNAMRPFHHREAGAVGFALTNDQVLCELIYDCHHVSRDAAELLLKCKGQDGVIAVSDSSMATGMSVGQRFEMWWHPVETVPGKVVLEGTNTLAGSSITLLDAFKNLAEDFGMETAVRLCSVNPRRALGITAMPSIYGEFDRQWNLVGIREATV